MQLPEYSLPILCLIVTACIVAIGLAIKRRYRTEAAQLFAAEAVTIPGAPDDRHVHPFAIGIRRDTPGRAGWLLAGTLHGLVRWVLYAACGVAILHLADWLFLPEAGRSARWVEYRFYIGLALVVMSALGQFRIRVASSGLWVFAFIVGFAWGSTVFGVVFVSVPAIVEQLRQGFLHALLVLFFPCYPHSERFLSGFGAWKFDSRISFVLNDFQIIWWKKVPRYLL